MFHMHIYVYISIYMYIALSLSLSICLSVCLSVCLSDCLSVCLSVCLPPRPLAVSGLRLTQCYEFGTRRALFGWNESTNLKPGHCWKLSSIALEPRPEEARRQNLQGAVTNSFLAPNQVAGTSGYPEITCGFLWQVHLFVRLMHKILRVETSYFHEYLFFCII